MNAVRSKLNYFKSKLDRLKVMEQELVANRDQFNKEYVGWLKEQGLAEQFTQIDLVCHFLDKKSIEVVS